MTSHFGGSNLTPFFWANTKNGQPILYTGNFGDGGDTTIQMQSRIQTALASKIPGDMNFISIWGGVNDIGTLSNTGPGSDGYYQTIADRIIDIAEQSMDAGVRPIIFTESGSTAFTSAQVETTLNLNQALSDWVDANQDSDYAPILFDAASIIWDGTPTTSIAFKANYAYDGLHLQVPGSEAVGDEFYELLTEHVVPTLRTPTGSELLQNTTYATTTGGTAGSGVTGAVPANWRTVRDNATVDSITYTTVGNKAHFVASASSTNVLNGFRFRQDPSITGLVGGDKLEAWGTVDIQGGPVALAECSLSLSLNYSDTTFALFYDGRTTSSRGDLSSTGARTLRIRAPLATVNAAKTLSSINYYFQCRMHASGAMTVDFYDASLRKI